MTERRTLRLATIGEAPEIARRNRLDWDAYLDEYEADNNVPAYYRELFAGITYHWHCRLADNEVSAAPVAFSTLFILLAVPFVTAFMPVEVTFSTAADIHLFVVYSFLALAAIKHRPPEFSRLFSFALAACATGLFHQAVATAGYGNVPLLAPALWLTGVGLLTMAISGIRQRSSLGCSHTSRIVLLSGGALHAVAYLSVIRIDSLLTFAVVAIITLMSGLPAFSLNRIWVASRRAAEARLEPAAG